MTCWEPSQKFPFSLLKAHNNSVTSKAGRSRAWAWHSVDWLAIANQFLYWLIKSASSFTQSVCQWHWNLRLSRICTRPEPQTNSCNFSNPMWIKCALSPHKESKILNTKGSLLKLHGFFISTAERTVSKSILMLRKRITAFWHQFFTSW